MHPQLPKGWVGCPPFPGPGEGWDRVSGTGQSRPLWTHGVVDSWEVRVFLGEPPMHPSHHPVGVPATAMGTWGWHGARCGHRPPSTLHVLCPCRFLSFQSAEHLLPSPLGPWGALIYRESPSSLPQQGELAARGQRSSSTVLGVRGEKRTHNSPKQFLDAMATGMAKRASMHQR